MKRLKCVSVLFIILLIGIQLYSQSLPNSLIIAEIELYYGSCHNPAGASPKDCPDSGSVIITGDRKNEPDVARLEYQKQFAYQLKLTPKNGKLNYWTIWYDFNDDNQPDKSEVFYARGRNELITIIDVPSASTKAITHAYIVSPEGYYQPGNQFNDIDFYIGEIFFHAEEKDKLGKRPNGLTLDLSAYPNPATDRIAIQLGDIQSKAANILLYNSTGQKMLDQEVNVYRGGLNTSLDVDHLERGIYHLHIKTDTKSVVEQIVLH